MKQPVKGARYSSWKPKRALESPSARDFKGVLSALLLIAASVISVPGALGQTQPPDLAAIQTRFMRASEAEKGWKPGSRGQRVPGDLTSAPRDG